MIFRSTKPVTLPLCSSIKHQQPKKQRRKRTTVRGKRMEAAQQRGINEGNAQETEASVEMDEKRKRRRWMEAKVDVRTDRKLSAALTLQLLSVFSCCENNSVIRVTVNPTAVVVACEGKKVFRGVFLSCRRDFTAKEFINFTSINSLLSPVQQLQQLSETRSARTKDSSTENPRVLPSISYSHEFGSIFMSNNLKISSHLWPMVISTMVPASARLAQ